MKAAPSLPTVIRRRPSPRLAHYDYRHPGAYFITLCARDRSCLFGDIRGDMMMPNRLGTIIIAEWVRTADVRDNVDLDFWVLMPNHFHGIVIIGGPGTDESPDGNLRAHSRAPLHREKRSLGSLIAQFKATTVRRAKQEALIQDASFWQRNYYEHVIRHERDLDIHREYIVNNPRQWILDRENPEMAAGAQPCAPTPEK